MQSARKWIAEHGERLLFSLLGLIFVGFSVAKLWAGDIAGMSAAFGIGLLSFIYANVERFKKFKGLGIEAELREVKKESVDLIERLKDVVTIYTKEVALSKVKDGRWSDGVDWKERWKLFGDLVNQHDHLGQKIDLSDLKKEDDIYYVFDMCMPPWEKCRRALDESTSRANEVISKRYGNPIVDHNGYSTDIQKLHSITTRIGDPLFISRSENLAKYILEFVDKAQGELEKQFQFRLEIDKKAIDKLKKISKLYESGPIKVTEENIAWANQSKHDVL